MLIGLSGTGPREGSTHYQILRYEVPYTWSQPPHNGHITLGVETKQQ